MRPSPDGQVAPNPQRESRLNQGTRRRYVLALTDGVLAVDGMVLGVELRDLRISYFGQTTGSANRQWHSTWHDPIRIPELVKVEWLRKEFSTTLLVVYPLGPTTDSPMVPR